MDSGIKHNKCCTEAIQKIEKRDYGYVIFQIAKPEGQQTEKVCLAEAKTKKECEDAIANGEFKQVNDEPATWAVFRQRISTYLIATGAVFVDYTSKDGRPGCDRMVFIDWHKADECKTKDKMKYSSTKVAEKMASNPVKHHADQLDELDYKEILEKVQK